MLEHPTTDIESSLLRTPVAGETGGGAVSPAMAKAKGQTLRLTGQIIDLVEPGRLPTPTVADQFTGALKSTQQSCGSMHSVSLAQVFHREDLFPTPTTRDHKDGSIAPAKHRPDDEDTLSRALYHNGVEWGKFEPSIRRWEKMIGREAPKPTESTGRDGQQQLSARFTEWMMGLDEGWITSPEIGLTRNEALKACGNGVVPQQAALALTTLLDGVGW